MLQVIIIFLIILMLILSQIILITPHEIKYLKRVKEYLFKESNKIDNSINELNELKWEKKN